MSSSLNTRASLILRLRNHRDAVAWDEFVNLYSPLIRRVAKSRGLQDADANELVQDVLLSIVKALPSFEKSTQAGSFRNWLKTIARNRTVNRLSRLPIDVSKRSEHVELFDIVAENKSGMDSERELEHQWRQQIFVLAAQSVRAKVQPNQWSAFWMTAVEDRSGQAVSKELGISLGAVYVARSRVLAKIREWVHEHSVQWESDHDC